MRPDIVVVILDDVSLRDLSRTSPQEDLPNMARIISSPAGVYSTNMFSMPTCSPSRRSILRGNIYKRESGSCNGTPEQAPETDGRALPARLQSYGYTSAMFGKYHMGSKDLDWEHGPFEQGFDYTGALMPANVTTCGSDNYSRWTGSYNGSSPATYTTYQPRATVDAFLDWYNQRSDTPRFAVIAPQLAHAPYHLPKDILDIPDGFYSKEEKFRFMLMAFDKLLGEILEAVSVETHVFVVADNGSKILDDGRGKDTLFDGGIQVPFLYRCGWPVPVHHFTGLMMLPDIYATILDIACPPSKKIKDFGQGLSLLPFTMTGRPNHRGVIYAARTNGDECVRSQHYKLIHTAKGSYEFYDLRADRGETTPLDDISDPAILTFFNYHLSQLNYFSTLSTANN